MGRPGVVKTSMVSCAGDWAVSADEVMVAASLAGERSLEVPRLAATRRQGRASRVCPSSTLEMRMTDIIVMVKQSERSGGS
jgi:hypothetical protein